MEKKVVSGIMLTLLLLGVSTLAFNIHPVESEPFTWIVDDDGPANFSSIQEAINSPLVLNGDIIYVHLGTYSENVVVNKTISLVGENADKTIIDGNGTKNLNVITVVRTNVSIRNFTIQHSDPEFWHSSGIHINSVTNATISGNTITNNSCGIVLINSNYTIISNNAITNNSRVGIDIDMSFFNTISDTTIGNNTWSGIRLGKSSNNNLLGNNITNNDDGISAWSSNHTNVIRNNITDNDSIGIYFDFSSNNTLAENDIISNYSEGIDLRGSSDYNNVSRNKVIAHNHYGIVIWQSSKYNILDGNNITANGFYGIYLSYSANYNSIFENDVVENGFDGITLTSSSNNSIYLNNFINNAVQAYVSSDSLDNVWDDDYPSGGNYWSDYTGVDLYWSPYQNVTGSDGIGDTPYVIDEYNQDNYPLMSPYEYWSNPILGDINKDMNVDYKDLLQLTAAYGSTPEKQNWNPNCDFNKDNKIEALDLFDLSKNYGKTSS